MSGFSRFFSANIQMDWIQLGSNIKGTNADDAFGRSISLSASGNVIAIGANGANNETGYVRTFTWNGTTWVQRGTDIIGDASNNQFGQVVSLSSNGTVLAVAAPFNDGSTNDPNDNRGRVKIYQWNGTAWNQLGANIDGEAGVWAGYSLSLSSNGLVVAIGVVYDSAAGTQAGSVRIYEWNGTNWIQRGVNIDGEAANSFDGFSVSISSDGSVVALSSPVYNGVGLVRVFEWVSPDWIQRGASFVGSSSDYQIGYNVALSGNGNTLVVPVPLADTNRGLVRIYDYINLNWVQRGSDIIGKAAEDRFGGQVAITSNGSRLIIGATQNDTASSTKGYAQIYTWNDNAWVQTGSDIIGTNNNDYSGTVSISADGTIVSVGALAHNNVTGQVRIFKYMTPAVPCLPAGTRVLTSNGYKAIEKLTKEDLIVTSDGNAVNYTVYVTKLSATNEITAPYLIPARTFGKFPVKDLTLSPNHAFQSRPGVWQIPKYAAEHLPEIRQIDIGKPVTYYHIETPNYFKDNLVVDGTVVESYAAKQVMKGEIFYSYSARYDGLIRGKRNQAQIQARLTKS